MKQIYMLPPTVSASRQRKMVFDFVSLSPDQRLVLTLFYHEKLTLDEIALVLEMPEEEVEETFYWGHVALGLAPVPEGFTPVCELAGAA